MLAVSESKIKEFGKEEQCDLGNKAIEDKVVRVQEYQWLYLFEKATVSIVLVYSIQG